MPMPEKALKQLRMVAAKNAARDIGKPPAPAAEEAVGSEAELVCPKCAHTGAIEEFETEEPEKVSLMADGDDDGDDDGDEDDDL